MGNVVGRAQKIIRVLLLAAVGGLFAFAGILKALDPSVFALDIDHYHILPWPAAALIALYLPWLEIICALLIAVRKFRGAALAILLGMTLVFLAALISATVRGLDISCGCFGGESGQGHLGMAIARDLAILAVIAVCLIFDCRKEGL
jgi:uncharacterized membrane protein YphA (DoxX/SURF4 family)